MPIVRTSFRTARFIGSYVVANLQAAMEYRVAFIVQIITMIANDSLWLFFWWTYFRQFPLVNGWQSSNIIVIWAVAACGFGIGMGVFGNTPKLAALIMNGGLDAYLGMPRNVLLHVCITASDPTAWGDILFAVGAFALLLHPDLLHFALFLLLSILGSLIFVSFLVIIGSLAFFLGNTEGLSQASAWRIGHVQHVSYEHLYRCCTALALYGCPGRVHLVRAFAVAPAFFLAAVRRDGWFYGAVCRCGRWCFRAGFEEV